MRVWWINHRVTDIVRACPPHVRRHLQGVIWLTFFFSVLCAISVTYWVASEMTQPDLAHLRLPIGVGVGVTCASLYLILIQQTLLRCSFRGRARNMATFAAVLIAMGFGSITTYPTTLLVFQPHIERIQASPQGFPAVGPGTLGPTQIVTPFATEIARRGRSVVQPLNNTATADTAAPVSPQSGRAIALARLVREEPRAGVLSVVLFAVFSILAFAPLLIQSSILDAEYGCLLEVTTRLTEVLRIEEPIPSESKPAHFFSLFRSVSSG